MEKESMRGRKICAQNTKWLCIITNLLRIRRRRRRPAWGPLLHVGHTTTASQSLEALRMQQRLPWIFLQHLRCPMVKKKSGPTTKLSVRAESVSLPRKQWNRNTRTHTNAHLLFLQLFFFQLKASLYEICVAITKEQNNNYPTIFLAKVQQPWLTGFLSGWYFIAFFLYAFLRGASPASGVTPTAKQGKVVKCGNYVRTWGEKKLSMLCKGWPLANIIRKQVSMKPYWNCTTVYLCLNTYEGRTVQFLWPRKEWFAVKRLK